LRVLIKRILTHVVVMLVNAVTLLSIVCFVWSVYILFIKHVIYIYMFFSESLNYEVVSTVRKLYDWLSYVQLVHTGTWIILQKPLLQHCVYVTMQQCVCCIYQLEKCIYKSFTESKLWRLKVFWQRKYDLLNLFIQKCWNTKAFYPFAT